VRNPIIPWLSLAVLVLGPSSPATPRRSAGTGGCASTSSCPWMKESSPGAPRHRHIAIPFSDSGGRFPRFRPLWTPSAHSESTSSFRVIPRTPSTSSSFFFASCFSSSPPQVFVAGEFSGGSLTPRPPPPDSHASHASNAPIPASWSPRSHPHARRPAWSPRSPRRARHQTPCVYARKLRHGGIRRGQRVHTSATWARPS
jgi:hypothetical protein